MEKRAKWDERESFYVTFVVQNHQLNNLPPADLKKFAYGPRQSFVSTIPKKPVPQLLPFL